MSRCKVPSNGMVWTKKTVARWLAGSTQNRVEAAPSQKNSPTAPRFSSGFCGWDTRTAKSRPKPTEPLVGRKRRSVMRGSNWSVHINFTVDGLNMRAPSTGGSQAKAATGQAVVVEVEAAGVGVGVAYQFAFRLTVHGGQAWQAVSRIPSGSNPR